MTRTLAIGVVAGIVLGAGYAASPATVWFLLVTALLFLWAGHGATPRERQWLWTLLAVAVALRVLTIVVLFATTDHDRNVSFFWDGDGLYMKQRSLWIRNLWLGLPLPPHYFERAFEVYGQTDYLNILAYMQYLLGPAPYGIHLFNVVVFLATCVLLYRLVRPVYGREAAFLGLAILLFLPTPFAWSVSALKESVFVFGLAIAVACVVALLRGPSLIARAAALAVLFVVLTTIEGLRIGGRQISTAGLAVGLLGSFAVRRLWIVLAIVCMVPLGVRILASNATVQKRLSTQLMLFAERHMGNVRSEGNGYRLLDEELYSDPHSMDSLRQMTTAQQARFVVRALGTFFVVPLPSQARSRAELVFLPQQAVWYTLVVLAVVGLVEGLRRDPLVTCGLLGMALVGGAIVALNSGNIGTMVRHRDTIVPFVVWLSALGAVASVTHAMSTRRLSHEETACH